MCDTSMSDIRQPQGPTHESSLPTTPNATSRSTYFEDMLPGVVACDERDDRMIISNKRRRNGIPLTPDEVCQDLRHILQRLVLCLGQYEQKTSTFLRTPSHALDYAERVAAYCVKDYARDFGTSPDIMGLWDTFNSIHIIGYAWRRDRNRSDGADVIATITRLASEALEGVYPSQQDQIDTTSP